MHDWIEAFASFPDSGVAGVVWAVAPTICVGLLFWFVVRAIIRADRSEREAQARYEAEEDARILAEARAQHSAD